MARSAKKDGEVSLTTREELLALFKRKFPGDQQQRTYLQLLIEGQAKAAIKGNTEAAKLLLRFAQLNNRAPKRGPIIRPKLKRL